MGLIQKRIQEQIKSAINKLVQTGKDEDGFYLHIGNAMFLMDEDYLHFCRLGTSAVYFKVPRRRKKKKAEHN